MKLSTKAECYLVLISAIVGMSYPLLHSALQYISARELVFNRFLLSALCLLPFIQKEIRRTDIFVLLGASGLALLTCGAYLFQTIGLETVNASRAAFITGANVLLVPFFSPFFNLGKLKITDLISGIICLCGLYILTGSNLNSITSGDFCVLLSALFFSLMILLIQWLTKRTNKYLLLTFYQILLTAVVICPFMKMNHFYSNWTTEVWVAVLFCSLLATAFSLFTQIRVQQYTTAPKSAIIFTLVPVFAYIFNWILNGETLLSGQMLGGALILVSIISPTLALYVRLAKKRLIYYFFSYQ